MRPVRRPPPRDPTRCPAAADPELRVQRAAHRQQLPRRAQQLGEQRVRRRDSGLAPVAAAWCACGLAASAVRAHADSLSDRDMRTLCYVVMPAVISPYRGHATRESARGPGTVPFAVRETGYLAAPIAGLWHA